MNKLFAVVSLVLAAFSFQANAATDLGLITLSKDFSNTVSGAFSDTYNFSTLPNSEIGVSATNVSISLFGKTFGKITDFSAILNGTALQLTTTTVDNAIAYVLTGNVFGGTNHSLVISGNAGNGASYGGSIAVAQTPIPAAVWLFGSALMGVMGIRRKKA